MPSPFPGMDPYLEDPSVWGEFHHTFIAECMYLLSDLLPPRYIAQIRQRVVRDVDSTEIRIGRVDVLRKPDFEFVARIELLSTWHKFGEGVGEYRREREALISGGTHVIEVDLLRDGERSESTCAEVVRDYCVLLHRAGQGRVDVWTWTVREPLPHIPVSLKDSDGDVALDLGRILNEVYDRAHFSRKLRYDRPPVPPLSPEDAAWAADRLKARD